MRFSFNEEQEELRRSARAFLREHSSSEAVRRAMTSERGFDPAVWRRMSAEMGWTAITIPEEYGGLGLGYVELAALLEETGAALLCSPFFATICLATNALLAGASADQKREWLPPIAAGQTTATLALTESSGRWDPGGVETTARREGGDYVIEGVKRYVPDGHTADVLLVAARTDDATARDVSGSVGAANAPARVAGVSVREKRTGVSSRGSGEPTEAAQIGLFVVRGDERGVARRLLPTMDQTRKQAEVHLDHVRVPASARLGGGGGEDGGTDALVRTLDLAAVAVACEQVGGAQRVLDMTVDYAKQRVQFGRPIGSFQAIKHKCADMLLAVESARSAAYYAAWAASVDDAELAVLASLAKAYCSDAYFRCAAEAVQIHGGVGFTWEADVHLHFKRAKSTETFLGDATYHRELVARSIGL